MVNQVPVNTIEITEKAANKVKTFAEQDGKSNFALRVAVRKIAEDILNDIMTTW